MSKSEIMLGAAVRRIGRWIVRFYYPKIEFDGKDQLPKTGPVLVCGNHPNSLVDPILIGTDDEIADIFTFKRFLVGILI